MTPDDLYRAVMMADPPPGETALEAAARRHLFGCIWSRPGLSVRDRRIVTIACVAGAVDGPATDAHVYASLASGDLTLAELNEVTLHFAVYCGWPKASHLEISVRAQWQRLHEERGEPVPAPPHLGADDLGTTDPAERVAEGARCFEAVNLQPAPPPDSPYFHAGILNYVFGHVWRRPGLGRRDRRLVTIACVGMSDAPGPIWSHVTSALASGDLSYEEMEELIVHFGAYAGTSRARALLDVAAGWRAAQGADSLPPAPWGATPAGPGSAPPPPGSGAPGSGSAGSGAGGRNSSATASTGTSSPPSSSNR